MNSNDIIEFLKNYKRMCDHETCIECPVYKLVEQKQLACCDADALIFDCPEGFAYAVVEWAKSHPLITNAMKFNEVFGIKPEEITCGWWNKEFIKQNS